MRRRISWIIKIGMLASTVGILRMAWDVGAVGCLLVALTAGAWCVCSYVDVFP